MTKDQTAEDLRIVAMKELIKLGQILNDVFDLDYGEDAERKVLN